VQQPFTGKETIYTRNSCGCETKDRLEDFAVLCVKPGDLDNKSLETFLTESEDHLELKCDECGQTGVKRT
jgi:hypothetical protein